MENKEVLATVQGRKITSEDMEILLQSIDQNTAQQFNNPGGKKRLVMELVNQEVLYLDALEKGLDNEKEFIEVLEKAKSNMLKQYALTRLMRDITVSEGEVIEFYNTHKEYFENQESVKASHILVDNEGKANEILSKIKAGTSFEEAAGEYSSCPSKEAGGDLGYFKKGSMVPEFEAAAFSMKPGEISKPVKTQFGYHIIKLVDKKAGGVMSFDEVKDRIVQQVTMKKQQDLYLAKTDELKRKYEVKLSI